MINLYSRYIIASIRNNDIVGISSQLSSGRSKYIFDQFFTNKINNTSVNHLGREIEIEKFNG